MRILIQGVCAVLAVWLIAGCSPPKAEEAPPSLPEQPCEQRPEFKSDLTVVFLDRTTRPSNDDLERWSRGVKGLLALDAVQGQVELIDLVAVGRLPAPALVRCLPARRFTAAASASSGTGWQRVYGWLQESRYGKPKEARMDAEDAAEINDMRKSVREELAALPGRQPIPDTATTDIDGPLRNALVHDCRHVKTCHVLMFSDMIDTVLKRKLATASAEDATQLARQRADEIVKDAGPGLSQVQLHLVAWGFGRNESGGPNPTLPPKLEVNLTAYWTTLFSSICRQAAPQSGVSLTFTAVIKELPEGC